MMKPRLWLVVPALLIVAAATAAPVPDQRPPSQGPISDYLRLRDILPATEPPAPTKAVRRGDALEVDNVTFQAVTQAREVTVKVQVQVPVQEERERTVTREGKEVKEKFTVTTFKTEEREERRQVAVTSMVPVMRKMQVPAASCKFFTVTREGKLEAITVEKAKGLLEKPAAIITGTSAELDPRQMELVKPGTLYVILGDIAPEQIMPPVGAPPLPVPPPLPKRP
jgi:hypothetical protein